MKSILVEAPRRMSIVDLPIPDPTPGEVRIRVRHAGICGSDLHIFHGNHPYVQFPRVIGHEFAGHIDAVGDGVDPALEGTRVAVNPVVNCGQCYPCRAGRPNVCLNLQVVGVHREGGFAEYCCVPAQCAVPVPDEVDDRAAATVEPFSIAANMLSRTEVMAEDTALVYGAGPIGMTVIQALSGVHGLDRLIVADRIDSRLDWARTSGASIVVNTTRQSLAGTLAEAGLSPSLIIDAACHPSIVEEALDLASPAARIGLMGFSSEASAIPQRKLNAKELTLYASRLNNRKFPEVIGWMSHKQIEPERFISHSFPATAVHEAFALLEGHPIACCKVLLDFN
ncbi:Zn-dependent oxidoreductase [Paracoccus saliphilus]|uniref:L-gulonate 5-dehydrogenase n=1 Tax=Paracoccus saliphilus TaxID=405559 RepID=A0AA45W2P5_9RHOB|nr:Zn-dependent oxidoreductase [Paracoccus saliphilus]WCR01417.1 Zn-dependent oxidoreductase [Paracoccus saliphilus]SIS69753.1 L-gulonate 5-dehydrogenase [Paracoccus saliphilus]